MKKVSIKTVLIAVILSSFTALTSNGATLIDMGHVFSSQSGITHVQGVLELSSIGSFTDETSIEALLNGSSYSIQAYDGITPIYALNNTNSTWDLTLSGSGTSALVTATESFLTIDFSTPEEITEVRLSLRNDSSPSIPEVWEIVQYNNVSDLTYLSAHYNAVLFGTTFSEYDSTLSFVPEPTTLLLLGSGSLILLRKRRTT